MSVETKTTKPLTVAGSMKMFGRGVKSGIAETLRLAAEGLVLATKAPQMVRGTLRVTDVMVGTTVMGEETNISDIATEENFIKVGAATGKFLHDGVVGGYKMFTEDELKEELDNIEL